MNELAITFADVERAAERIRDFAVATPVLRAPAFDRETGVEAFIKCENLQRGGAFKLRGASNAISALEPGARARGIVAYSSGNHAQAVAITCCQLGIPATIVMPSDAPRTKLEATRGYGAEVVLYDRQTEDRTAIGGAIASERGATVVPPFDHPDIIAGQGTAAMELLTAVPDLDALVVCLGGGGLLAGCAVAAQAMRPGIRIFGVEPETGDDWVRSLAAGHPVAIGPPPTIADGLRTQCPGKYTFPIVRKLVERVVTVSDAEIVAAMRFLLLELKVLAEPSGAVAAAALLAGKLTGLGRTGVVISGGNVDAEVLADCLAS